MRSHGRTRVAVSGLRVSRGGGWGSRSLLSQSQLGWGDVKAKEMSDEGN